MLRVMVVFLERISSPSSNILADVCPLGKEGQGTDQADVLPDSKLSLKIAAGPRVVTRSDSPAAPVVRVAVISTGAERASRRNL